MLPPARPVLVVADLDVARRFYVHALGCTSIGSAVDRLDLELSDQALTLRTADRPDGDGVSATVTFVLGVDDWCGLSERLRAHGIDTVVEPARRFSVVPGEQCAMRLHDPDGNAIELRGFALEDGLMAA